MACFQRFLALSAVASVLSGLGCAHQVEGPTFLTVSAAQYDLAFDAACKAARDEGLVPEVADHQSKLIDTHGRFAPSLMEPWSWSASTPGDVVEATLGFERRRAHFEFVPTEFKPVAAEAAAPLVGPVLPGSERGTASASADGKLELRVTVSVERQFRPGYQGPAYTRSLGSYARDVTAPADPTIARDRSTWTPVARDERLERELIARIAAYMPAKQ